jgi:hypothetical protein
MPKYPLESSRSRRSTFVALAASATLAAAGFAALVARPPSALACECSRPGVEVSPGAGVAAPTNTVVRVSWWVGEVKIEESTLLVQPAGAEKDRSKKKSRKDKGKSAEPAAAAIEVEASAATAGQIRTVTLRPKAPLLPATRYEVRVASVAGEKTGVIGEFTTGAAADATPPAWAGVTKATYVHEPAVCCNCSTDDPYAQIDLTDGARTKDDATPATALVYGVWLDDGSKLEAGAAPATAPLLVTRDWGGKLYLGHKSTCTAVNFELPTQQGPLKLRVAPIDLAGHVGKVASVTIDVPKPKDAPAAARTAAPGKRVEPPATAPIKPTFLPPALRKPRPPAPAAGK